MLNKLTHMLLQGIAKALTRYANSIEKFLAEKKSSALGPLSDDADDGPPAHWLEKIRQGVPYLLDHQTSNKKKFITHFENKHFTGSEHLTSSNAHEVPPAHWINKVRQGAPYLLDKQTLHEKNAINYSATKEQDALHGDGNENKIKFIKQDDFLSQSPASKKKFKADHNLRHDKSPGRITENKWFTSVKGIASTFIHPKSGSKKAVENISENLMSKISQSAQHNYSNNRLIVSTEYKTAANEEIDFNQPESKNLSSKSPETGGIILDHDEQFKKPDLGHTCRNSIKSNSDHNRKNKQQFRSLSEQTTIENRPRVHLHPPKKVSMTQQRVNDLAENLDCEMNSSSGEQILINKDLKKKFELGRKKTAHFSFANAAKEHMLKNQLKAEKIPFARPLMPAESVKSRFVSEDITQQYRILASNMFRPSQSDFSRWPNLPDEMEAQASNSRWPQLPKENWFKSDEKNRPAFDFWQLQEEYKRKSLSEQEQRGEFWSA